MTSFGGTKEVIVEQTIKTFCSIKHIKDTKIVNSLKINFALKPLISENYGFSVRFYR